jgi:hypothetical protein
MATANRLASNRTGPRRRVWLRGVLAALVVLAGAYWFWREPIDGYSSAGASYAAHSVCSCRYIGGRDLASCKGDLTGTLALAFVSEDEDEHTVTARIPPLSSQTAHLREGYGCVLDAWEQ